MVTAEPEFVLVRADRDIKAGEEITIDNQGHQLIGF